MSGYSAPEPTNYDVFDEAEMVRVDDPEDTVEVRCNVCRGSGTVFVRGFESDCIDCEGFGSVLVPTRGSA